MRQYFRSILLALLLLVPAAAMAATPAELIRELGDADFARKAEIARELAAADTYEVSDYRRVAVRLKSGLEAFVYVGA